MIYRLKARGSSLSALARLNGVRPQALGEALHRPSSHIEQILADALGLSVTELFPERFDAAGQRLHRTRPPERTPRGQRGNVQKDAAA